MDPNHDIVPTLRMVGGLMTDAAADEILRLRARADAVDAYLRRARALYFQHRGGASTPMAIFFNDALQANGTYEADHAAHEKREQAARDKLPLRHL